MQPRRHRHLPALCAILPAIVSIRDAIRSVPAKPGIVIALSATLLFGVWHVHASWQACEQRAKAARHLHAALEAAAGAGEREVRLAEIFPFPWDEVRITSEYSPGRTALSCSFALLGSSHWSLAERHEMARQGGLSALSFFVGGEPVAFVEYRNEWSEIHPEERILPRQQARLRLKPKRE